MFDTKDMNRWVGVRYIRVFFFTDSNVNIYI